VKPLDHLGDEVGVAGGVDDRDLVLTVLEGADGEAQRLVPLLLLGLVIEMGGPVVHAAEARDRPGSKQHLLRQRRLAAAGVTGQHDAADVGEIVALQRHRARFLSVGSTVGPGARRDGTLGAGCACLRRTGSGTTGRLARSGAGTGTPMDR
jgi:hypothetical protein